MSEERVRIIFALSADGIKQLKDGKLILSSGGLRRQDGSLYEMATPVYLEPDIQVKKIGNDEEDVLRKQLAATAFHQNLTLQNIEALMDIEWMNYAVNCRSYEMTYQGFQILIGQLDDISTQLDKVERKIDSKEFYDRVELTNKYKNHIKSIAGHMETKNFNASSAFLNIAFALDEIEAYFLRLHNELSTGNNDQIILGSIIVLIGPYSYVIRRYSALYYYENGVYPPNYNKWAEVVNKITKDYRLKRRIYYYLRVNSQLSIEDVFIAGNKAIFNLQEYTRQIDFDHTFVLQHTKDQYLSIDKQLQKKIEDNDFYILDDYVCIEL